MWKKISIKVIEAILDILCGPSLVFHAVRGFMVVDICLPAVFEMLNLQDVIELDKKCPSLQIPFKTDLSQTVILCCEPPTPAAPTASQISECFNSERSYLSRNDFCLAWTLLLTLNLSNKWAREHEHQTDSWNLLAVKYTIVLSKHRALDTNIQQLEHLRTEINSGIKFTLGKYLLVSSLVPDNQLMQLVLVAFICSGMIDFFFGLIYYLSFFF